MPRWSLHGLVIEADLDLGVPACAEAEPVIALTVVEHARPVGPEVPTGTVLLQRVVDHTPIHTAARDGSRTILRIHGLCDFVLTEGSGRVECIPDPALTPEQLVLLVRGALLAFFLAMRGECVLHASAVDLAGDGLAVAFVGGSGWGKSTMAAWLCSVGARLIVDDLLRVDRSQPPRWIGTGPEVRLRPTSVSLATSAPPDWSSRSTADGRTAVCPLVTPHGEGPLGAVVLPLRGHSRFEVVRLDPVEALLELIRFPRLEGWKAATVIEAHFDVLSRLTDSVPVYRASVPWGPPFTPEAALDLLAALGMSPPPVSCAT